MQHPGTGRAHTLHGAQFFLAGLQHGGKIAEAVDQVMGDAVGVLLRIGQIEDVLQRFVLSQAVQPVVLHPLPHPLAVTLVPFLFCHDGSPFLLRSL